jgi:hypothetical protein
MKKSLFFTGVIGAALLLGQQAFASTGIVLPGYSNVVNGSGMPETAYGVVGSSITSPNALGAVNPSVFLSFNYETNWTGNDKDDGDMGIGGSFGNARRYVGVSVAVLNDSLGYRTSFLKNTSISVRLNRYINHNFAIAIGAANVYGWNAYRKAAHSYYAVATNEWHGFVPITASLGAGTGAFNSISDAQNKKDSNLYPFASVGFGLIKHLSFTTDWSSDQLAAGFTYAPNWFKHVPIAFNASLLNITLNRAGGTKNNRAFVIGVVTSYSFV